MFRLFVLISALVRNESHALLRIAMSSPMKKYLSATTLHNFLVLLPLFYPVLLLSVA